MKCTMTYVQYKVYKSCVQRKSYAMRITTLLTLLVVYVTCGCPGINRRRVSVLVISLDGWLPLLWCGCGVSVAIIWFCLGIQRYQYIVDCIMVAMATAEHHVALWIDFMRCKLLSSLWLVCVVRLLWRARPCGLLWATPFRLVGIWLYSIWH